MPCNTIQTATVNIGKVDKNLLAAALEELGIQNWFFQNDQLIVKGRRLSSDLEAEVKRAYSKQVVFSQAKKFGWQMKEIAQNKWEVIRR